MSQFDPERTSGLIQNNQVCPKDQSAQATAAAVAILFALSAGLS